MVTWLPLWENGLDLLRELLDTVEDTHFRVLPPRGKGAGVLIYQLPSVIGWGLLQGVSKPWHI